MNRCNLWIRTYEGILVAKEFPMANDVLTQKQSGSRRFAPLGIIFGLLGLLLFAYFVSRAGVGEILSNIQRLGAGFLLIIAVSSTRYIVRALAWTRCIEPPHRLPFRKRCCERAVEGRLRERSRAFDGGIVGTRDRKYFLRAHGRDLYLLRDCDPVAHVLTAEATAIREYRRTRYNTHHYSAGLLCNPVADEISERRARISE